MGNDELKYRIGIGLVPKIGPVLAKRLITHCGSIEGIFRERPANLAKIPGIGEKLAAQIIQYKNSDVPDREIRYIEKHKIRVLFYLDENYPERLRQCEDAPLVLYVKGTVPLSNEKVLSIVGTRNPTEYGKQFTQQFITDLARNYPDVLIVSGLAYGIDICAHRTALKNNLNTIAVLGHGLSTIYPSVHTETARQITTKGALVTEFMYHNKPEAPNFIRRNRIIAGLSDATIVVESGEKGGALITADIANSYNRDVFAIPGRTGDIHSRGCNKLIKSNQAALMENLSDLEYLLGWHRTSSSPKAVQREMFVELEGNESILTDLMKVRGHLTIDQLAGASGMPVGRVASLLLSLEFKGVVKCLPGKVYMMLN